MEFINHRVDQKTSGLEHQIEEERREDYTELAYLLSIEEMDRLKSHIEAGKLPASSDDSVSFIAAAATDDFERAVEITAQLKDKIGKDRLEKLELFTLRAENKKVAGDISEELKEIFSWIEGIRTYKKINKVGINPENKHSLSDTMENN